MAAEAIVGAIVETVASLAADAIAGQLRAAWGLEGDLEKLKGFLLEIQSVLADAEEKQTVKPAVKLWLNSLKKVAYEAEDVLDELNYETLRHKAAEVASDLDNKTLCSSGGIGKVRDFFSSHNPLLIRCKMGRKVSDLLEEINKIADERLKFKFNKVVNTQPSTETAAPVFEETCSFVEESQVVGRRAEKGEMVELLLSQVNHNISENVAVLPIVGMGGLGKTTLAQFIYNDPRVLSHFELRAWVCVSDPWDTKKIIQGILSIVNKEEKFESANLEELQLALRKSLTQKRFLIVLDDVWEEDPHKWGTLKGFINCGHKGSAVIVTTRSDRVSEITGTLQTCRPSYLSEEESWDLFSKRAFAPGAEKPQELVEIGKAIANKCKGLPLALRILGSLLYEERDRSQWLKIKESDIWNTENDILPILRLSYKRLPSHSKRCFAFCAVFPKDYEMDKEVLIDMWMAHGFIPSDGGRLEVKGNQIFNQLVQRSFLQDLKERIDSLRVHRTTCRMHDLIHDLAQSIAGNDCVVVQEESPIVAVTKDTYHLSFPHVQKLDMKHLLKFSPRLRTIMQIVEFWEVEDDININISALTYLRVLLIPGLRLPSSLKRLQHLRYLSLSSSELSELPESICALLNLQTLDLSECKELLRLPKRTPCMISLRHLYLDDCDGLEEMPRGMGRMTNLQTLTMYAVGEESAGSGGIGELKELHLSSRLYLTNLGSVKDAKEAREVNLHSKDLNSLVLSWGGAGGEINAAAEQVLEELKPPRCLKSLIIHGYEGLKCPTWMAPTDSLPTLQELEVFRCPRLTSLTLDDLTALRSLELYNCNDLTSLLPQGVSLPTLQELKVHSCPRLTSLALDGLTALRSLKLYNCNDLISLLPEGVSLPTLQELRVDSCPRLTSLALDGLTALRSLKLYICDNLTSLLPQGVSLPTLQELRVDSCPRLTSLALDGLTPLRSLQLENCTNLTSLLPQGVSLPTLQELRVDSCPRLTSLALDGLTALRSLQLYNCNDLISLLPEGVSLPTLQELNVYSCSRLTSLALDGLTALRSLKLYICDNLTSLLPQGVSLPTLQELRVDSCPRLTSLALDGLTALRSLQLENCTNLTSLLPQGVSLPTLQELRVDSCPRLTSLALDGLTALRSLKLKNCTNLTSLLPQGVSLPTLQELEVWGCPELEEMDLNQLRTGKINF